MNKPFSQACLNNRDAILHQLSFLLTDKQSVLEVGSGTGQHAVYFSEHLPHIQWQTSDLPENHSGIGAWIASDGHKNCLAPLDLNVAETHWHIAERYDAVFTANTLHIMSWEQVCQFYSHVVQVLKKGSLFIVYGPFNYQGSYTSDSNARFDEWLKLDNPNKGIRDIEAVNSLAEQHGFQWLGDYEMPANNRLQVWSLQIDNKA